MAPMTVSFVTNRNPIRKRTTIVDFGTAFHDEGVGELRFGLANLDLDKADPRCIDAWAVNDLAGDDDVPLSLDVFPENLSLATPKLGSRALFEHLRGLMKSGDRRDTLVYVHGYSTTFREALAAGFALQWRLRYGAPSWPVNVVVFTWPSDGSLMPWKAYRSDRQDAFATGPAFGRAFLKLRDFMAQLSAEDACERRVHLLCHSMGNYVLQNALPSIIDQHGGQLPRIFDQIVMAAPDVDADALETAFKLGRLPEAARRLSVYINDRDKALMTSDVTKGNPARLGLDGPSNLTFVPDKVEVIDCSEATFRHDGAIQHHYYLEGRALADVANTLAGRPGDRFQGSPRDWRGHRRWWVLRD